MDKKCWRKWAAIVLEKTSEKMEKAGENMVEKTGKVSNHLEFPQQPLSNVLNTV